MLNYLMMMMNVVDMDDGNLRGNVNSSLRLHETKLFVAEEKLFFC